MSYRTLCLVLILLSVSALAGAATLPASPSPATAALPWLQPAANSTPVKPDVVKPGTAPLGAIFKNGCSQACLTDESTCFKGCGSNQACKQICNNDYHCCLQACNPTLPQCP